MTVNHDELRFQFGKNWSHYLRCLDNERVREAEKSLLKALDKKSLEGVKFLDAGCGSGLFSLAARRLGAEVFSFDYDENSVKCAQQLRAQFFPEDEQWKIEQGSVLDWGYIEKLGQFDVVYSWGVLHHTGNMWQALSNVNDLVNRQGCLFVSIYNDQGNASKAWKLIKKWYNSNNRIVRLFLIPMVFLRLWGVPCLKDLIRTGNPLKTWTQYSKDRGMSPWYDYIDWIGGYPFEVAKPEEIFHYYQDKGFILKFLKTCAGGLGCNEFVFQKIN